MMQIPDSNQCNELLTVLDDIAVNNDVFELGLDPHDKELNAKYRKAIQDWYSKISLSNSQ